MVIALSGVQLDVMTKSHDREVEVPFVIISLISHRIALHFIIFILKILRKFMDQNGVV